MPKTVKELLVEIKDTTELMVDLAYSAILFDNEDIAEEVLDLEGKISDLIRQLRVVSILAGRRAEEAELVSSVLHIASAAQKIGESAGDIATLVLRGFKLPKEMINEILLESEETLVRAVVSEDSEIADRTLGEIRLHSITGMKVIAIKRGFDWIFDPDRDVKIRRGDVLFARGDISGVKDFFRLASNKEIHMESSEIKDKRLEKTVSILIEIKDLSELSVDLGYSSIIFYNEDIAQEVYYLEEKIDNLKMELLKWTLQAAKNAEGDDEIKILMSLIEIAYSSEVIADAAKDIAGIVVNQLEIHPIFKTAMLESDEIIAVVEVLKGCELDGKTLGEAKVETNTGMHVLAIKRGNRWITKPRASTKIEAGDLLFVKGPKEGEKALTQLCSISLPA
ncbi:TrkA C-terminal domain-containing protein [Geoglobus acetivorans]|uniref:Potassium channel protein n=1 Tax=Geoglobus acetivorans TaxID=565033 RepID=A0ABZ3H4C6_GEOAI|nr:potassium channel protein [Geoglobus acetivorans]